jgi:cell division transport system permease protein
MSGFGYLVKEGFRNVWSNRIMSIASICVLISCLVLTGAAGLISLNVAKAVEAVGQTNETTIYLKDEVTGLEAVYLGKDIEKIDNIISVTFYPKEDAIQDFKDSLPEDVFMNMQGDDNPLPDAYIIAMADLSKYDETIAKVMEVEGVDSINNRSEIAKKLTDISELVSSVSMLIVIALMIISLFIIANTIRATMYSRRFEISIMKSVGATNSFVRLPFLVEGIVIGIISSLLATAALAFVYEAGMTAVREFIPMSTIPFSAVFPYVLCLFVSAGIVVGALGSSISIRKYLKMEGNEILGW